MATERRGNFDERGIWRNLGAAQERPAVPLSHVSKFVKIFLRTKKPPDGRGLLGSFLTILESPELESSFLPVLVLTEWPVRDQDDMHPKAILVVTLFFLQLKSRSLPKK